VLEIDRRTGLVKEPKYPCLQGQGLCLIRRTDEAAFDCGNKAAGYCAFRTSKLTGKLEA